MVSKLNHLVDLVKVGSSLTCRVSTRRKPCKQTKCKCSRCNKWCNKKTNNRFYSLNLCPNHNLANSRASSSPKFLRPSLIISSSSSRCNKCSKNLNCHKPNSTRVTHHHLVRSNKRKTLQTCSLRRDCRQNPHSNNRNSNSQATHITMDWLIYHWQESRKIRHRQNLPLFLTM